MFCTRLYWFSCQWGDHGILIFYKNMTYNICPILYMFLMLYIISYISNVKYNLETITYLNQNLPKEVNKVEDSKYIFIKKFEEYDVNVKLLELLYKDF